MNWGDCVTRSGTSFDRANYTDRLVEGTPTEMQLFRVSEVSAAPASIWASPFFFLLDNTEDAPVLCPAFETIVCVRWFLGS